MQLSTEVIAKATGLSKAEGDRKTVTVFAVKLDIRPFR